MQRGAMEAKPVELEATIDLSLAGYWPLSRSLLATLPHLDGEDTSLLHLCFLNPQQSLMGDMPSLYPFYRCENSRCSGIEKNTRACCGCLVPIISPPPPGLRQKINVYLPCYPGGMLGKSM